MRTEKETLNNPFLKQSVNGKVESFNNKGSALGDEKNEEDSLF